MTDPVVVVPADLEIEDRIAGPLTFRMASWLALSAAGAALLAAGDLRPLRALAGLVLVALGVSGAFVRLAGLPLAAWVLPLLRFRGRTRRRAQVMAEAAAAQSAVQLTESAPSHVEHPNASERAARAGRARPRRSTGVDGPASPATQTAPAESVLRDTDTDPGQEVPGRSRRGRQVLVVSAAACAALSAGAELGRTASEHLWPRTTQHLQQPSPGSDGAAPDPVASAPGQAPPPPPAPAPDTEPDWLEELPCGC